MQESVSLSDMRYKGGTTTYSKCWMVNDPFFPLNSHSRGAWHRVPESGATVQGTWRRLAATTVELMSRIMEDFHIY